MEQGAGKGREDVTRKYKALSYMLLAFCYIFAFALVIALTTTVVKDMSRMMDAIDDASPLDTAQKIEYLKQKEKLQDDIVVMSFYVIVVPLIVVFFLTRRQIKKLERESARRNENA